MGTANSKKWTQIRVSKETRERVSVNAKAIGVTHDRLVSCALRAADIHGYMHLVEALCKAEDG